MTQQHPRPVIFSGHTQRVMGVAWSPDGTQLVSAGWDATIRRWDALTGQFVTAYRNDPNLRHGVAWSPDGTRLASGSWDSTVQVWEANTGMPLLTYRGHTDTLRSVAWSPDSTRIASAGDDTTVQVWSPIPPTRSTWTHWIFLFPGRRGR